MLISGLKFIGFRNLEQVEWSPDPGFNVIWGKNAQGKTNILEGIFLLATLKSFRTSRTDELIGHDRSESSVTGRVLTSQVQRHIEVQLTSQGKRVRLDHKPVRRAADVLGYLRPVLFAPEEVGLAKGPPGGRRDLLDRAIFQANPAYLDLAQQYAHQLRQRNRLLREAAHQQLIEPWSEGLIASGARIREERSRYMVRLRPLLQETYSQITAGNEQADLAYPQEQAERGAYEETLRHELAQSREAERRLGQTLAGPHRDDPAFIVEGRNLRSFGSQGQQRSFILAFKTAQIGDLENQVGEPPVLLLDDITSELDSQRKNFFFRFLRERRGQVFVTTTDPDALRSEGLEQARYFHVKRGKLYDDEQN